MYNEVQARWRNSAPLDRVLIFILIQCGCGDLVIHGGQWSFSQISSCEISVVDYLAPL